MNILIIGNGFDIAHGLETKYGEFLHFAERFEADYGARDKYAKYGGILNIGGRKDLRCIDHILFEDKDLGELLHSKLDKNLWIEYFSQLNEEAIGQKWVDFEAEIERVIIAIDKGIGEKSSGRHIEDLSNHFFSRYTKKKTAEMSKQSLDIGQPIFSYDALLNLLKKDCLRLTDALEIYLFIYVERFGWKDYKAFKNMPFFDKVLSFNYTDTYMRLYDPIGSSMYNASSIGYGNNNTDNTSAVISLADSEKNMQAEYCFVHGKVREGIGDYFPENEKHIVLGISDEDDNDRERLFISDEKKYHDFQKFILRARYGDKSYTKWIDSNSMGSPIEVHIIGHSLAYSDRDILRYFLLNNEVKTVVYYLNENERIKMDENLFRLVGKAVYKELSDEHRIEFRPVNELW